MRLNRLIVFLCLCGATYVRGADIATNVVSVIGIGTCGMPKRPTGPTTFITNTSSRLVVPLQENYGRGLVRLISGKWPETLVFEGRVNYMQEFSVSNGDATLQTGLDDREPVKQEADTVMWKQDQTGKMQRDILPKGHAYSISSVVTNKQVEFTVPKALLEGGTKELGLEWIVEYGP